MSPFPEQVPHVVGAPVSQEPDRPDGTRVVSLSSVIQDDSLWVRYRLDQSAVRRYADALKAGQQLPLIEVADVDGALFLVDGRHRIEAMRLDGRDLVDAKVTTMTLDEVAWGSALLNLRHGVPLKYRERRRAFNAYVQAGQHKKGRSRYKTYREMGADLGFPFSTVRNWMRADHPGIYKAIGDKCPEKSGPPDAGLRERQVEASHVAHALAAIDTAFVVAARLQGPVALGSVVARLEQCLHELKLRPHELPAGRHENPQF